jgi:Family of unknown function (DUF6318)
MGILAAPDCPRLPLVVPRFRVRTVDKMLEGPESGIIPLGIVYGAFSAGCPKNFRTPSCLSSALMTAGGSVKKTSAALLAASILLAGCSGDTKPDPSSSSTSGSSPATTTPTPTTASPTTASVPPAGAAHTKAGAEAFSRYFFNQVNRAWSTPNPTTLDGLYAPTCTTCAAIRGSAADYESKGQRYRDTPLTGISASSLTNATGATTQVRVTATQEASAIVDRNGKVVEAVPRTPSTFVLTLTWVTGGWKVTLMQVRA